MPLRRALLLAVPLLLTACGGSSDPAPGAAPSAAGSASAASPSAVPSVAEPLQVVLRPDGLEVGVDGSAKELLFGSTPADDVTRALQDALGSAGQPSDLPDCGQGPRSSVQFDGLSVLFDRAEFVGWSDEGSPERNSLTSEGLGIQSSLADLRSAFPDVDVQRTSLGTEWSTPGDGGLSGFLDGTQPTSRVTSLSAGETCVFR